MNRNDQSLHFVGMHTDCKALYACTLCINVSSAKHESEDVNIPTDNHACT